MVSCPAINMQLYSFLVFFMYLGETMRYYILRSYCLTSDMGSEARTSEERSSAPSSIGFAWRQ